MLRGEESTEPALRGFSLGVSGKRGLFGASRGSDFPVCPIRGSLSVEASFALLCLPKYEPRKKTKPRDKAQGKPILRKNFIRELLRI